MQILPNFIRILSPEMPKSLPRLISSSPSSWFFLFFLLLLSNSIAAEHHQQKQQGQGFLLFCPCMGRFGNQMEQLLGVLAFARRLNRTLVLPPFVEYPSSSPGMAQMRPFESIFRLAPLTAFHPVLPMAEFMRELAASIWPPEERKVLCWSPRPGLANSRSFGCHATEGNPFGPFWRHAGIEFVGDEFFGERTGGVDVEEEEEVRRNWASHFPVSPHPVLAFSSAPAAFPVRPVHRPLQRFFQWSEKVDSAARQFIARNFGLAPFVAVHLRNGPDWANVCQHLASQSPAQGPFFASAQCTGDNGQFGQLSVEACDPPIGQMLDDIQVQVSRIGASAVFVSSDWRHHLAQIEAHLAKTIGWRVKVAKWGEDSQGSVPAEELAILGHAHHFIANCLSTFSAFVVRQRHFAPGSLQPHRSCSFFAFPKAAMERLEEAGGREEL